MVDKIKKENCYGCGACEQRCTNKCIQMVTDDEGFIYPRVNMELCSMCGMCSLVCPSNNPKMPADYDVETKVAYANDSQLRSRSSSGGLFSLLANSVINQGGVVFGARMNEDHLVYHAMVEDVAGLEQLRGSKYLQSRIGATYKETENQLRLGRVVLYVGTACQISGLKSFLSKDYQNLYTVDVLCHGVPSEKVWKRYIDELQSGYDAPIKQIEFRKKIYGWKEYSVEAIFANDKVYSQIFRNDAYMRLYLSNVCLRPSCYICQQKKFPRVSDITIGDAWGVSNFAPHMDDDNGTSVVVINSSKGKELWNSISQLRYISCSLEQILPSHSDSRRPVKTNKARTKFFEMLNNGADISALISLIRPTYFARIKKMLRRLYKKIVRRRI